MIRGFLVSFRLLLLLLPLLVVAQAAFAEEKLMRVDFSVQALRDSNFSRAEENDDAEQVSLSAARVDLSTSYSQQKWTGFWRASQYRHQENTDFNSLLNEGGANWSGNITSKVNFVVDGVRNVYLADRLEFFEKDLVTKDEAKAVLGYGNDEKLSFRFGARQGRQAHSNTQRENLNFNEDDLFTEVGYSTANRSTIILRAASGSREYPNNLISIPLDDLNYDYRQLELETLWIASPKTKISSSFTAFDRIGALNDSSGLFMSIDIEWAATPKLRFNSGFLVKQPPIGETLEQVSKAKTVFLTGVWQLTTKLSFTSGLSGTLQQILVSDVSDSREERVYSATPVAINFKLANNLSIRFDSKWIRRESTLSYRDFIDRQAAVGLFFNF